MKDIEGIDDIKLLVDDFYRRVKQDELLAPIFSDRISDWEPHLETMYRFWNAALFQVREYVGNPFARHVNLPVGGVHFERWISLFYKTLDEHFEGPVTTEAKQR